MSNSQILQIDLGTGAGQEQALRLMTEMLAECEQLRSENFELQSKLSEWERENSSASSPLQEAVETVEKLTEKNLRLRLMTQEAATRLSELASTNELLWDMLEEKNVGIGEMLDDYEHTIVAEIRARQDWIRRALSEIRYKNAPSSADPTGTGTAQLP